MELLAAGEKWVKVKRPLAAFRRDQATITAMDLPTITSLQNPRVKEAVRLRDRKGREQQGRILIEGVREIGRALEAGVDITEAFFCETLCVATPATGLLMELRRRTGFSLLAVSAPVMSKLSFGDRKEGVIAIARLPETSLNDLAKGTKDGVPPLFAVVEGVEKPGNLGAILRTADAAGVSGLIVASGGTDLYNPNTIRSSLGAVFSVPVCTATSAEALAWLRKQKLRIFATRVDASLAHCEADFSAPSAIILGSEARGLSSLWTGSDITPISLPMLGRVDSLNISAAAAILFYEALRQRNTTVPCRWERG